MYIHSQATHPINDIPLDDISRASLSNNAVTYSERLNSQLNDAARHSQTIAFEDRFLKYTDRFQRAPDDVRANILHELDRELNMLDKEQSDIQDPPEMRGRRTFGKGGPRRLTAAEIAEKELQQNDR